jgi:hypothetical protein
MTTKTKQLVDETSLQFSKDLKFVADMKANPRNAIMAELAVYWHFKDQRENLFERSTDF